MPVPRGYGKENPRELIIFGFIFLFMICFWTGVILLLAGYLLGGVGALATSVAFIAIAHSPLVGGWVNGYED